jgi:hypothetical protein
MASGHGFNIVPGGQEVIFSLSGIARRDRRQTFGSWEAELRKDSDHICVRGPVLDLNKPLADVIEAAHDVAQNALDIVAVEQRNALLVIEPLDGIVWRTGPHGGSANLSAGFGDIITSGLGATYLVGLPSGTEAIRQLWLDTPGLPTTGAQDVVNPKCSWAYTAGQVAGVADVMAIAGLKAAAVAVGLRTRIAIHGAHHTFGPLGKLAHIQINWWREGVKGSGRVLLSSPLPWR